MEYYIGQDYALGGITLLCKFDGQRVTMASQGYEGDETISSLYKVVSEEATMLTFDTYNAFIMHMPSHKAEVPTQMPTCKEIMSLL